MLPTLCTAPLDTYAAALQRLADVRAVRAQVVGVHLEGPYINVRNAGAQDTASIRPSDIQELTALMTEAPRLGRFSIAMLPWCSSTIFFTMARPRPVPRGLVLT